MTEQSNALDNAAQGRLQTRIPLLQRRIQIKHQQLQNRNRKLPLSSKAATIISTYNVRTIKEIGKIHQLISGCIETGIDIVAIQEHRWQTKQAVDTHIERVTIENNEGEPKTHTWRFDYSSATPEGQGGVGILMNDRAAKSLISVDKISERIIIANFKGNPNSTIIAVYAPTEDKLETVKDKFYDELYQCVQDVPLHNILLVMGDFNARIGKDKHFTNSKSIGQYVFHEESNDNGKRLVDFCEMSNMRSTQAKFPHPKSRVWTWQHPNNRNKDDGNRAQLDHILIRGKWINFVENVKAYNTVEVGSDHRIVSAKIKIKLRVERPNKCIRTKFDWEKLRCNQSLQKASKYKIVLMPSPKSLTQPTSKANMTTSKEPSKKRQTS
jgi:exonuclease III